MKPGATTKPLASTVSVPVISYLVDVVRMAAPSSWWPREIWLQSDVELLPEEKSWLSESLLHFNCPSTAIFVPDALLSRRPKAVAKDLFPAFETEPISEIATDLGYARIAAFSKSFRRWTGVSPSAYRKANQHGSL